jgi:putative DNA primase/helicase
VGAAGELATRWGVTGWEEGAALEAAAASFRSWLKNRGTTGSFDYKRALDHVREMIQVYRMSRFLNSGSWGDSAKAAPAQVWGYIADRGEDGREYQLPAPLPRDFCGAFSSDTILRALDSISALVKEEDRLTTKRRLPDRQGKTRCYVIRDTALFPEGAE